MTRSLRSFSRFRLRALSLLLLLLGSSLLAQAQTVRYVKPTATGTGNGSSWANASGNLQAMINASSSGQQVWAARGTYKPGGNDNADRTISFAMKNGVSMYGGFAGSETTLSARPTITLTTPSSTTLSGDVGEPGYPDDNSFHVILNRLGVTNITVLDGFVITGGNANEAGSPQEPRNIGGGLCNVGQSSFANPSSGPASSPQISNCLFTANSATSGGAIYNGAGSSGVSSPTLTNCVFRANAASDGGAIYNGGGSGSAVQPKLTDCLFQGNSATISGGAIYNYGSTNRTSNPELTNCSFQDNIAAAGGAMFNNGTSNGGNSSPTLTNCSFKSNRADSRGVTINDEYFDATNSGGAIVNDGDFDGNSSPLIRNCSFQSNSAVSGGGAIFNLTGRVGGSNMSSPKLTNCLFQSNTAPSGGALYNFTRYEGEIELVLTNCTFRANTAGAGGVLFGFGYGNGYSSNTTLINCVLFGNGGGNTFYNNSTTISATYSLFDASVTGYSGSTGNRTATVSPFASASDPALFACSPAVNAGLNSATGLVGVTTDLAGNARVFGDRVDMGAYEYQAAGGLTITVPSVSTATTGVAFSQSFTASGGSGPYSYSLASGSLPTGLNLATNGTLSGTPTQVGSFSITVKATNATSCSGVSAAYVLRVVSATPIRYVRAGASGSGNSWADASGDLQSQINFAGAEQVWVAGGTYKPGPAGNTDRGISFSMKNGVPIYGGFAGNETSLSQRVLANPLTTILSGDISTAGNSADNSYHVINNPPGLTYSAVLDGFLITGGNASASPNDGGGGMFNNGNGAGNSCSPLIRNCLFLGNTAANGGGALYNAGYTYGISNPSLINCAFQSNTAGQGGAIFNDGSIGGNSNPSLTNCSFQANSAGSGGAMSSVSFQGTSRPVLTNCVVWGNGGASTFSNQQGAFITSSYSLFESSVTGYNSGTGNLTTTTSPFLSTTDTRLNGCSTALNAGDNAANSTTTDLAGNARVFGNRIDMGAYEYQTAGGLSLSAPGVNKATLGVAFNQSFTASGGSGPYSYSLASGSLPTGLSLASTGVLSGTPTQSGSFTIAVLGRDAIGCSGVSAPYVLTVTDANPTLTGLTASPGTVCVGSPVTFTATVGNVTGCYGYTLTNGLGTSLSGTASGTSFSQSVTASGTGPQTFTLTVRANDQSVSSVASLTVNPLPVASLTNNGPLSCAQTSVTLTAGGGTSYTFTNGNGVVGTSGGANTVVVSAPGTYSVTVASASGCVSSTSTTVVSNTAVVMVSNPVTTTATLNASFSQTFTASGGSGPYSYSLASGNLPTGLSLATTGVLSGTPTQAGSFTITVLARDANSCSGVSAAYMLMVNLPACGAGLTGPIWTGCLSTDWNTAGNWASGAVPTATDDVVIPSAPANQPVLSTAATAKSVEVQSGASLSITVAGNLTINDSKSLDGNTTAFSNRGTVQNAGQLVLGNTAAIGQIGFWNRGIANNAGGQLSIDRSTTSALLNSSGTFTNTGAISIGSTVNAGSIGLRVDGGTVVNNPGGAITINRTGTTGLLNDATFVNASRLTIGDVALSAQDCIFTRGAFTNTATGEIRVDRANANGIWHNNGTFRNDGKIGIGTVAYSGVAGILTDGTSFVNSAGAEIQIDRVNRGLTNRRNFTNAGQIRMGNRVALGERGMQNGNDEGTAPAVFTNQASGLIQIDQTAANQDGITNRVMTTFINAGTVAIGTLGSIGGNGISNAGTFSNSACATLTTVAPINNGSSFTNAGLFTVSTTRPHSNTGTLTNNGLISYLQGNPIPNVVNNYVIAGPISSCSNTITPALQLGDNNSQFAVGTTWYTDPALTQSAGTYNQGSNTFTATNLAPGSNTTLYLAVTDNANGCTKTVSISVTLNATVTASISPTNPTLTCASPTVSLTASGGSSYIWDDKSTNAVRTVSSSGTYSVTVSTGAGCSSVASVSVSQDNTAPLASLVSSGSLTCSVTSVTLTASPNGQSYVFSSGASQIGTSNQAVVNTSGIYSVTVLSANGCSSGASTTVVGDVSVPVANLTSNGPISCSMTSITLTASGGSTYRFSSGASQVGSGSTATVSTAGIYSVTVTGNNGCTATASTTVTGDQTVPIVSLTNDGPLSCTKTSVILTASGGINYAFAGPGLSQTGATATASVTTAGIYSVTVTNANYCSATASTTVTSSTAAVAIANPTVTAAMVGQAFSQPFTATGGTSPYNYSLTSGSLLTGLTLTTTGALSGTPTQSGSFTITVLGRDAIGCSGVSAAYVLTVNEAASPNPTLTGLAANPGAVCVGSVATFTATVGNVTGSYNYTLTNGLSAPRTGNASGSIFSQSLTAIGSGTQTFTLTVSANGQSVSSETALTVNPLPVASLINNGPLTCAQSSVTLTAGGAAGVPGSSYTFANGSGVLGTPGPSNTLVVNSIGIYSVTVALASGCVSTTSTSVTADQQVPSVSIIPNSVTLTCASPAVSLTAVSSGMVRWSTGEMTPVISVSVAGPYSVTAVSANGCTAVASTSVGQDNSVPVASLVSSGSLTCSVTSVTLTASAGGQTGATLAYRFSGGATPIGNTNQAVVSTSGIYSVTVLSANGCSSVASTSVSQDNSAPVASLVSSGTLSCAVTSVTLTANSNGLSYVFSAGATQLGSSNQAVVNASGTYSVTVVSANGCSAVASTSVNQDNSAPAASLVSSGSLTCSVTSVTLTANPNGQSYVFSSGATQIGISNQAVVSTSGIYSVTVLSGNGCTSVAQTTVEADQTVHTVRITPSSATLTCATSMVSLTAIGSGSVYWSTGETSSVISVSMAGTYSVTLTSGNSCTAMASAVIGQNQQIPTANIAANPSLTIAQGQSASLIASVTGSTAPFGFHWSTGEMTPVISVSVAGPYSVSVTGSNGCSATASAVLSLTSVPMVEVPFAITAVTIVSCTPILPNRYSISFTPRYSGLTGQPIAFRIVNELLPTTEPGPYTIQLYTDNPRISLGAVQTGTPGEAIFEYNWLAACLASTADNTPPRLVTVIPPQSATVGVGYSYVIPQGTFTDDQTPGSLRLSIQGLPPGISLSGYTLSGVASTTVGSPFRVTLTATDPGNLSVSTSFSFAVAPASLELPQPSQPFAITGVSMLTCTPIADRININFSPRYAGLTGQTIAFRIENELAATNEPGPYSLTLYRDNPVIMLKATQTGSVGEASFAYNWLAACATQGQDNTPPRVISPVGNQTVVTGTAVNLNLANVFFDQETPQELILSVTGLPSGLILVGTVIQGVVSTTGVSNVVVTATDGGGLSASTGFTLTVTAPNSPTVGEPSGFTITGVQTLSCVVVSGGQRAITFQPQYGGVSGGSINFSVVNERAATTDPGPYTLTLYTDNPTITLNAQQGSTMAIYRYNWLVGCTPAARVGSGEASSRLKVRVLGNPVEGTEVVVEVQGVQGQPLRLQLTDLVGHLVSERLIDQAEVLERQTLTVGNQSGGVLLLQVNTPIQSQTIKVIRR